VWKEGSLRGHKDAHDREAIVAHLKKQLRRGDKSLVGNKGYRRYLKVEGDGHLALNQEQIKADGIWVLRTNTVYNAETVAHFYKALWTVEDIFRTTKRLNSNKGTKTPTGLSPKAIEQAFGSLRRCGNAVFVGLPAACSWPLGSNGTVDAVKVHRPRDWASRGDDLGVKHRNTFYTFCHCHRDSVQRSRPTRLVSAYESSPKKSE